MLLMEDWDLKMFYSLSHESISKIFIARILKIFRGKIVIILGTFERILKDLLFYLAKILANYLASKLNFLRSGVCVLYRDLSL